MKKLVSLALLSSLALYADVSPISGYKYGNLEVAKQYGKVNNNGYITTLAGHEVGEFYHPSSIAVLSDGSYWVVDQYNHRIQHFTKSGEFLGKVGAVNSSDSPITGTDNASFNAPMYIAQDSNDNIYVTDSGNKRIQKFSSDGTYVDTIANAKIGSYVGVAVDSENNIWVSDDAHNHLWKLSQLGAIVAEAGFTSGTTYGSGNGDAQFNRPGDIEVASDNSIWVAEYNNDRVQHISSTGGYLGEIASTGPHGVALSTTHIYVIRKKNIVSKYELTNGNAFTADYYFERTSNEKFGLNNNYNGYYPSDIEINGKDIWLTDSDNNRLKKTYESEYK